MRAAAVFVVGACLALVRVCHGATTVASQTGARDYDYDCPLCDSSVYGYCSSKLLHDACCCLDPRGDALSRPPVLDGKLLQDPTLPYQCKYADCSFLHANTCREHHLITRCCCDRLIRL